jgi:flagellar hook-length control protein FliK
MTSTPVNDIAKTMLQGLYAVKADTLTTTTSKGDNTDAFSVMIGQSKKAQDTTAAYPQQQKNKVDSKKAYDNQQKGISKANKTTKTAKTKDADKNVALSDAQEQVTSKTEQIKQQLADKLGISLEDLENVMAELGLTLADLTDASNMVVLVNNLTSGIDALSLMTDETAFTQITELTDMVTEAFDEIAEELGVTVDEVISFIETMEPITNQAQDVVPEQTEVKADTPVVTVTVEDSRTEENTQTVVESHKEEVHNTDATARSRNENKESTDQNNLAGSTAQTEVQTFGQTDVVTTAQDTSFSEMARTQEILDQIAEYVKINARPEVTEMEIQLNPANLGTVNLQVAAKDGTITAQLITQNEQVRQALESQAFVLKDSLEQQGIKVDAVEVTIASHEFERNLEQDNGQSETEQAYEKQLKKGTRRINLEGMSEDEIDNLADEMSEAEMIQIDMMNRNGNKIDFMA